MRKSFIGGIIHYQLFVCVSAYCPKDVLCRRVNNTLTSLFLSALKANVKSAVLHHRTGSHFIQISLFMKDFLSGSCTLACLFVDETDITIVSCHVSGIYVLCQFQHHIGLTDLCINNLIPKPHSLVFVFNY